MRFDVTQVHKAVIIEGRMHHAFSFVCRKTLLHLGSDWALQVFHSRLNNRFVREVRFAACTLCLPFFLVLCC